MLSITKCIHDWLNADLYAWHEIFNFKLILFSSFFLHVYAHFIFIFILDFCLFVVCPFYPFLFFTANTFSRYLHSRTHTHAFTFIPFLFRFLNRLTCSELSLIILSLISRETDDLDGEIVLMIMMSLMLLMMMMTAWMQHSRKLLYIFMMTYVAFLFAIWNALKRMPTKCEFVSNYVVMCHVNH